MSKRFLFSVLVVILTVSLCTSAFAISGASYSDCDDGYKMSGIATFLLDSNGRIAGVLKPSEDLKKLGFQTSKRKAPKDLKDGMAIRRRAFIRVSLDDDYKVIKGGKDIEITLILTNYNLVESILGEGFSVDDVIDATIYSPDVCSCKPHAAHMFLPQGSGREKVGKIIFNCGGCLDLYAGDFDRDCELELGFRAVALQKQETECKPPVCEAPPCNPCTPCTPCTPYTPCTPCQPSCPTVTVTTNTCVTTTVCTTTTTSVGNGCNR